MVETFIAIGLGFFIFYVLSVSAWRRVDKKVDDIPDDYPEPWHVVKREVVSVYEHTEKVRLFKYNISFKLSDGSVKQFEAEDKVESNHEDEFKRTSRMYNLYNGVYEMVDRVIKGDHCAEYIDQQGFYITPDGAKINKDHVIEKSVVKTKLKDIKLHMASWWVEIRAYEHGALTDRKEAKYTVKLKDKRLYNEVLKEALEVQERDNE